MDKLWLISAGAQIAEMDFYCFGICNKIEFASFTIDLGEFAVCKESDCKYEAETLELVEYIVPKLGARTLVCRRLIDAEIQVIREPQEREPVACEGRFL